MKKEIFEIVAQVMNIPIDSVNEELSMDMLEKWDSLHHIKLILAIEERFGIQFTDNDIVSIDSVKSILEKLAN